MRLSEIEFRVRQTENYIKLSDELKDLKGSQKKQAKDNQVKHEVESMLKEW